MSAVTIRTLSAEGQAFLRDARLHDALSVIAASVGVSPEEYLLRFEEVLSKNPQAILGVFEGN